MRSRPLAYNSLSGVETIFHESVDGNSYGVETVQDVQPVAEENLLYRNDETSGWKGTWHRVASVPFAVYAILAKQPDPFVTASGKVLDQKRYTKWLNSADAAPWRVKTGRV